MHDAHQLVWLLQPRCHPSVQSGVRYSRAAGSLELQVPLVATVGGARMGAHDDSARSLLSALIGVTQHCTIDMIRQLDSSTRA